MTKKAKRLNPQNEAVRARAIAEGERYIKMMAAFKTPPLVEAVRRGILMMCRQENNNVNRR